MRRLYINQLLIILIPYLVPQETLFINHGVHSSRELLIKTSQLYLKLTTHIRMYYTPLATHYINRCNRNALLLLHQSRY